MNSTGPHFENGNSRVSLRHFFVAVTDVLGALLLVCWGLLLGPLGVLRGTLSLSNMFWYIWVLSPQGLLSRLVKAAIDWRLGNFDAAVFQMEFLCSRVEHYLLRHPRYRHAHTVLEDFYTLLVRAYLHGGHIDDAMMVVLRAKKHLNTDRLPALARLDAKTAHLVRAGLAAGKLLDGGGLATLFVKSSSETSTSSPAAPVKPTAGLSAQRQGATASPQPSGSSKSKPSTSALGPGSKKNGPVKLGQIIPFPAPQTKSNKPESFE